MVVALDDCTSSVMKVPERGAAALLSTVRREEPARALSPLVMIVMPSRKQTYATEVRDRLDMNGPS